MAKLRAIVLASLVLAAAGFATAAPALAPDAPKTVVVRNGPVTLHALLWRPRGRGPFPAILFNHGSGRTPVDLARLGPYERGAYILGPVFARHGYEFLYLFRRGVGLSADQGANDVDLMDRAFAAGGQGARNALQLQLLQGREMGDALAGLAFLRGLPDVDARDVGAIGHSFGSSLTLLMAEREPGLRAVVTFSGSAGSWARSPQLRQRLLAAATRMRAPVFLIQAANDYSVAPGRALDEALGRLGRPHRLKIYPPIGHTAEDGHAIAYRVGVWESDVFAFLGQHMRRRIGRGP